MTISTLCPGDLSPLAFRVKAKGATRKRSRALAEKALIISALVTVTKATHPQKSSALSVC